MKSKISHICISVLLTSLPWAAQAQKAVTASQSTADENQPAVVAPADTTFSAKDSLKLNSMLQVATKKPKRDWSTWRPDTKRAMWLAIVLPGAGQIYNRKYWKLPIIYGGFVGCAYAITWNNQMYHDYSQAYMDIMDDDPTTDSYNQFLHLGATIDASNMDRYKEIFRKRKDRYRRWRDMGVFVMIGVYAFSIIDAYVDASLSEFDISDDLTLRVEPAFMNSSPQSRNPFRSGTLGLQCSLTF
uniref:DUF5683 domain-containing protein n=1 Tax=Prevotella sp. TaxID=59823 RepID=UPI0025FC640C